MFDDTETRSSDGQGVLRGTGELSLRVTLQVPIKLADSDPTQFVPVRAVARAVMQDIRRAIAAVPLNNYAGTTPDGPRFPVGVTGLRITGRSLPPLEEDSSYQSGSVDLICTFNETHLPKE